jgi:hypothetical protein
VQAWVRWPKTRPRLPADEDDDLYARRLVAQRCLYGVDKNPMATDLAKLSLWLATLARDHEFTFLDHALKSGDSLVGLTRAQIAALHWDASKPGLPLFSDLIRERLEAAVTGRKEIREAPDDVERAIQEARYQRIEGRLSDARHLGDAVLAAFFSADKPDAREAKRQEIESWVNEPPAAMWMNIGGLAATLRRVEPPIPPFHWELEFPEVFARKSGGFDAIVGNPPFLGGSKISGTFGHCYLAWLLNEHSNSHGNSDLVAHFFRRAFTLSRDGGAFELIATNTISQGDTRQTGLENILRLGGDIGNAIHRLKWPGEAAVIVSIVGIVKGMARNPTLDGRVVRRISAYLSDGDLDSSPFPLTQNDKKAFGGSKIYGQGFLFDDAEAVKGNCSFFKDMDCLIEANSNNANCIFPYIGGEEVNNDPQQVHSRYVIDFGERSEEEARSGWPELMVIVETRVKPERDAQKREARKRKWWLFGDRQPGLYRTIIGLPFVLATNCGASPHLAIARLPAQMVFAHSLTVLAFDNFAPFSVLQCRAHEVWARFFSSSLKDDLRYAPSDCFRTFPFPEDFAADTSLEAAGEAYHAYRANLMIERTEGLTKTYNRFHDRRETAADIVRLRELHAEMDLAVLGAYGWDDLAECADPQFLDETNEDDHKYQGRLFWPAEFRDEVLACLLALNAERAAAERENEPLAARPRRKKTAKGLAEVELLESVAADEDD